MFFKYNFFIVMIICVSNTHNLGLLENSILRKFVSKEGFKYNTTTAITYPCFSDGKNLSSSTNKTFNVIEILQNLASNETAEENDKNLDEKFYDAIAPIKKYYEKKEVKHTSTKRKKGNITESNYGFKDLDNHNDNHEIHTTAVDTYDIDNHDNTNDQDHNNIHSYDDVNDDEIHVQHVVKTKKKDSPSNDDISQDYFDEIHDYIHSYQTRKKKQKVKGLKSLYFQTPMPPVSPMISRIEYPGLYPVDFQGAVFEEESITNPSPEPVTMGRPCTCGSNNNHNCVTPSLECTHTTGCSKDVSTDAVISADDMEDTDHKCSRPIYPPTCSRGESKDGTHITTPYSNSNVPYFNTISTDGFLNISGLPTGVPYFTMKVKDLNTLSNYWMFSTPYPQNAVPIASPVPYYTYFYNQPRINQPNSMVTLPAQIPDWKETWKTMTTCYPLFFYPTNAPSTNSYKGLTSTDKNSIAYRRETAIIVTEEPTEKPCVLFLADADITNDTLLEFDSKESVNAMVEDIFSLEAEDKVELKKCYCSSFGSRRTHSHHLTFFLMLYCFYSEHVIY